MARHEAKTGPTIKRRDARIARYRYKKSDSKTVRRAKWAVLEGHQSPASGDGFRS